MKANRMFKANEDAVSPVIGVILMVAITVVLAAVVFVLVSDLGGEEAAPQISFDKSTSGTETVWTVVRVSNGPVAYSELTYDCVADDGTETDPILGATTTGDVGAGHTFRCDSGDTLRIVHDPTGSLIHNRS